MPPPISIHCLSLLHPRTCPPSPSPHPFPSIPLRPAHAYRALSQPISIHSPARTHRPRTSAAPRSLMPPGPVFSIHSPLARTYAHPLIHNRSSPHPFPSIPLPPHCPRMSAHPRSLMPTRPFPHAFPSIPLHAQRPHTCIHASTLALAHRALLPTHFHPLPCAHTVGTCPRASALAHAHPILNSPDSPPISIHSLAPTPSTHIRASTLAHAYWIHVHPFPCAHTVCTHPLIHARSCPPDPSPHPFSFILLRPRAPFADVRTNQLLQHHSIVCPISPANPNSVQCNQKRRD